VGHSWCASWLAQSLFDAEGKVSLKALSEYMKFFWRGSVRSWDRDLRLASRDWSEMSGMITKAAAKTLFRTPKSLNI
jgi:hypothetical protein